MCCDGKVQNCSSVWRVSRGEYTLTDCQCSELLGATVEGEEVRLEG